MPIPTVKQIQARKNSVKARKVMLAKKKAKGKAEGTPDQKRLTRQTRKEINQGHVAARQKIVTGAQQQHAKDHAEIVKLMKTVDGLQVIDPDHLLLILDELPNRTTDGKTRKVNADGSAARRIDLIKAIEMRNNNVSLKSISEILSVSVNGVRKLFRRYDAACAKIDVFKHHRADLFADLQRRLLTSFTDNDILDASLQARVSALCSLYEKERLERGQSTANVHTIHDDVAAIKAAAAPSPASPRTALLDI